MDTDSTADVDNTRIVSQTAHDGINVKSVISVEKLLKQSSDTLIKTLDNFQDGIFVLDKNWNFTYANNRAASIIGLKPADIVGKNIWKDFPHAKDNIFEENYRLAMQNQEIRRFETKGALSGLWFDIIVYPSSEGVVVHWRDITQRKQAEEALKASQDRMRAIAETSVVEISVSSLDGTMLFVNDAYAQTFGYSKEELIGYHTPNLYENPKDREKLIETLKRQGYVKNFETRVKRKDGTPFWVAASITVIHFGGQQAVLGVSTDITKRKQAEEALKQSEQLYKAMFDNSEDGFQLNELLYDENGKLYDEKILKVNHAWELQTGIKGPVEGKTVKQITPEIESSWFEIHQDILRTGKPRHFENYSKDTNKFYDVYCFPYAKNVIGILFRDIAERKNLEKQLKQRAKQVSLERERFFNIVEDLPVMVCLITPDYQVPYANRLFREKFGESAGQPCYVYCGSQTAPCSMCESMVPLKTGKPHHWVAHFPSGLVVEAWDFPFTDVDGKKMILEVDVDVTERVNLQKQLQEKERMAAIGATAGMVGHDLRNPLHTITGEIYLAESELRSLPDSEQKSCLKESIQTIAEQISYMDKIVSDLQTFVKPVNVNKQEIKLKPLIVELVTQTSIPNNIEVNLQTEETLTVQADTQLLKRVLINLITNAIQAMPKGGKLTIKAQANNSGQLQIDVKDTGTGIPEEIKPKLFTPLFTTKAKGQGFGLAVCKRVIEAQGGTISFESQEGKGTKFTIQLPR